ncbi:NAD/NADP transhydrogenase alpha subunit-like protein [Catenulispora acidiphila DSM 44928]|uniref:proton-translocating NAD(P)(+) transhydrogenase n=1 Tax=Catenulispora acidiphila (strain DSM 44928 / JCM 14897 / NBRC 102108 / NRRL B-24433 / ID139908) TaxID=479433 RepID=C7PYR3_CATAD|nr:NAD(P) transhydrogenase subunit alpha [Catenulispora acidiphila]ACU77385.1 NAD/NADP transhydrogenase alpha subunit-like protein [Catenulispora acidiphila DSM 44928]
MSSTAWLTVFVLAVFLGFEVISKVSSILHTPLMSGANAVHGVILVGAIIATGSTTDNLQLAIGLLAIVMATVNMVGGFAVTDRMLGMFAKPRRAPGDPGSSGASGGSGAPGASGAPAGAATPPASSGEAGK